MREAMGLAPVGSWPPPRLLSKSRSTWRVVLLSLFSGGSILGRREESLRSTSIHDQSHRMTSPSSQRPFPPSASKTRVTRSPAADPLNGGHAQHRQAVEKVRKGLAEAMVTNPQSGKRAGIWRESNNKL